MNGEAPIRLDREELRRLYADLKAGKRLTSDQRRLATLVLGGHRRLKLIEILLVVLAALFMAMAVFGGANPAVEVTLAVASLVIAIVSMRRRQTFAQQAGRQGITAPRQP